MVINSTKYKLSLNCLIHQRIMWIKTFHKCLKDSFMSRIPLIEIYTINNAIIYQKHIIHLTVILSHFHLTWHWINKACMDKLTSYEMMLPMLMMLLQKVTGTRILDNSMECSRNNVFFLKMTTWDRMGMRKMCFEHVYFQRFMNRFKM